jgi:phasin family protein
VIASGAHLLGGDRAPAHDKFVAAHKSSLTAALQHGNVRSPQRLGRSPAIQETGSMSDAADTVKSTVEQFTAATNTAFKDNVEKSLSALNEANAISKKNLEAVIASVAAATKGAEVLGAQAIAFSKSAFENQVTAAKSFSTAKSVQEVVELQTAFAKSAIEAYMAEVGKMSELVSASAKDTLQPLNERVTAVVEKIQSAR